MAERLNMIRLPAVCKKVGLSSPTIYRLMKTDQFPKSKKISARAVAWVESEIDEWIKNPVKED